MAGILKNSERSEKSTLESKRKTNTYKQLKTHDKWQKREYSRQDTFHRDINIVMKGVADKIDF